MVQSPGPGPWRSEGSIIGVIVFLIEEDYDPYDGTLIEVLMGQAKYN